MMKATILLLLLASLAYAQQPVQFETIAKDHVSGHKERKNYVIKNQDDWRNLWNSIYTDADPKPPLPEIDFSKRMVIAVFQGQEESGGYDIVINGMVKTGKKLRVFYKEKSPAASCPVTYALSRPFHIIETDMAKKVFFTVDQEILNCSN